MYSNFHSILSIFRFCFSDTLGLLLICMSRFKFDIDYSRDTCISLNLEEVLFWILEKSGSASSMSSSSTVSSQGPTFTSFSGISSYWQSSLFCLSTYGSGYYIVEGSLYTSWSTTSCPMLYDTWLTLGSWDICTILALPRESEALTLSLWQEAPFTLYSRDAETSLIISKSDGSNSFFMATIVNIYINSVWSKVSIYLY